MLGPTMAQAVVNVIKTMASFAMDTLAKGIAMLWRFVVKIPKKVTMFVFWYNMTTLLLLLKPVLMPLGFMFGAAWTRMVGNVLAPAAVVPAGEQGATGEEEQAGDEGGGDDDDDE